MEESMAALERGDGSMYWVTHTHTHTHTQEHTHTHTWEHTHTHIGTHVYKTQIQIYTLTCA
jgi:hypothetical protein